MNENSNIFLNKKILVYGLGKSGISTFNFLKRYNKISLFDDSKIIKLKKKFKNKLISINKVRKHLIIWLRQKMARNLACIIYHP